MRKRRGCRPGRPGAGCSRKLILHPAECVAAHARKPYPPRRMSRSWVAGVIHEPDAVPLDSSINREVIIEGEQQGVGGIRIPGA